MVFTLYGADIELIKHFSLKYRCILLLLQCYHYIAIDVDFQKLYNWRIVHIALRLNNFNVFILQRFWSQVLIFNISQSLLQFSNYFKCLDKYIYTANNWNSLGFLHLRLKRVWIKFLKLTQTKDAKPDKSTHQCNIIITTHTAYNSNLKEHTKYHTPASVIRSPGSCILKKTFIIH